MATTYTSVDKYLEKDSNKCPNINCLSEDIEGGSVEIDTNIASQEVSCNDCGMTWRDEYQLTNFVVTEDPQT